MMYIIFVLAKEFQNAGDSTGLVEVEEVSRVRREHKAARSRGLLEEA